MSQLGQMPGTGAYRDLKETKQVTITCSVNIIIVK